MPAEDDRTLRGHLRHHGQMVNERQSVDLPRLFTVAEVAEAWGHSEDWWTRRARRREVPHHLIGRQIRFSAEDIARIMASSAIKPAVVPSPAGQTPRSLAYWENRRRGEAGRL